MRSLGQKSKRILQPTVPKPRTSSWNFSLQSKYPFAGRNGLAQQLSHGAPCDFVCCETHINELQSPACIINLETVEQNCRSMELLAAKHNVHLRTHLKTHKTQEIAEMQLRDQTDKRIEVSTIPEAYFYANKGYNDILYGIILSESKFQQIEQIAALQAPNLVSVMTDSLQLTQRMIDYAKHQASTAQFKWNIFIKVDSGAQRAGFDITRNRSDAQAKELLDTVKLIRDNAAYCRLHGVYQYSNSAYTVGPDKIKTLFEEERQILMERLMEIRNECKVDIPIVSSGSTPACMVVENFDGITEIHPGNYVFFDRMQYEFGVIDELDMIPISVMSRIIGRYPHRNELLIDCGNVGISLDRNEELEIGYGSIQNHPNLKLYKLSQEVGKITSVDGSGIDFDDARLQYGEILRIIPHHSCLMACQHPYYYIVNDEDRVIDIYHKVGGW